MLAGKAKKARENDGKHDIVNEGLNTTTPGLPALSKIATTTKSLIEPKAADIFAE